MPGINRVSLEAVSCELVVQFLFIWFKLDNWPKEVKQTFTQYILYFLLLLSIKYLTI